MSDIQQHHVSAWHATVIAAEFSKDAAIEIIIHMKLIAEFCDKSDYERICDIFGGKHALDEAIENRLWVLTRLAD